MPYNRLLRWELFRSERFLSLPSDTHRLIFTSLLTESDDFGNLEGGARRLWRWMQGFSQVKLEQDAIKILSDLQDSDLIRRYEVESREFWHIPRFYNQRTWWSRICPPSPWCDVHAPTGKGRNPKVNITKTDAGLTQVSHRPDAELTDGVGVGVGVKAVIPPNPLNAQTWECYASAYAFRYGTAPVRNAKTNSCISNIVKRLGNDAPEVASFYLTHNDQWYVKKRHPVDSFLGDCEGLRTQWKTGKKSTGLEARSAEQKDAVIEQIKRVTESLERKDLEKKSLN